VGRKLTRISRARYVARRLKADPGISTWDHDQQPILFFSPEAGFKASSIIHGVLARTLKEAGHPVVMARCFQLFERCPVMDLHGLPYQIPARTKADLCAECADISFHTFDSYGLEALDLRGFLTPEVQARYHRACDSLTDDLSAFEYESIPFGRICLFDIVLHKKISQFDQISADIREGWKAYIKSSLLSFCVTESICDQVPVSKLVHVNNYAMLLGAKFAAQKRGIAVYSALLAPHKGNDYSRYIILPELIWESFFRQGRAWPKWRDLALDQTRIEEITDDTMVRFSAQSSHTYSPPRQLAAGDIRSRLGLAPDKKLLVAYTSSLDEILALDVLKQSVGIEGIEKKEPFSDQIDWLQQLISFGNRRDDLQLIVRIHPREGVNRRDSVVSQHLKRLKEAFDRPIPNCRFVWPADPVSSYDLAEVADVALISWSTIGVELARLGVPVITSTSGVSAFPHDDFLEFGATPAEYFEKLAALLERPMRLDTISRAFRWYNLFHLGTSLDLTDLIPRHDSVELPAFKMPAEAEAIERIIIQGEHPLELNYERLRGAQTVASKREETLALQAQMRRIIHFFHTGEDARTIERLLLVPRPAVGETRRPESFPSGTRAISLDGSHTRYVDGDKVYSRYSPLCARLAVLSAEASDATSQVAVSLSGAVVYVNE
jgi:hypothetical protein